MNFSSKNKNIFLILTTLFVGVFIYFYFIKNEAKAAINKNQLTEDDYEYYNVNVKDDTLSKFGFCAKDNYVIKEDADVRRTPNKAMYNSIYKLRFGTKVYTKNIDEESNVSSIDETLLEREKRNNFVAIYALKPILLSDMPVGYIHIDDIIKKSEFQNYKPKEKIEKPIKIDSEIKFTIENNLIIDGMEYQFAKNVSRLNESLIYADFNDDATKDFAVILDNFDATNSMLQIYLYNPVDNIYSLVYQKAYPSLLKIKLIKKEHDVMVNSEISKFPFDGILITNTEFNSFFHIYNIDNKNFMVLPN